MNTLKFYSKALLFSVGFFIAIFLAGCGGGGGGQSPILGLPTADLVTVAVSPATASIPGGATQQFMAIATFKDGSSRDVTASSIWTSGTAAVATVNSVSGVVTGIAGGASIITAGFGGKTGSATLTVTSGTLVSIAVTPANPSMGIGGSQQFLALGTYSDGTTRDITSIATFTSGTPGVATILANGLATGKSSGSSVITAAFGARSGTTTMTVTQATLVSITVTPLNASIAIGSTQRFVATSNFSDGTSIDISNTAIWTSGNNAVATVSATGVATGVSGGSAVITAASGTRSGSANLTVNQASALVSIAVTPSTSSIGIGGTQRFVATGTFADGTNGDISSTVLWTSNNTSVATVLTPGVASGNSGGTATITATSGAKSGSATVTVASATPVTPVTTNPLIVSNIVVSPLTSTIVIGGTQRFIANNVFSDGSMADSSHLVTWTSANTAVATILPSGVASGVATGTTIITANFNGKTGTATLVVTPPGVLTGIAVTPANPIALVNSTLQFTATGTYSDGAVRDITTAVVWSSSAQSVATILQTGLASAISVGATNISATQGLQTASTVLTVNAPIVTAGLNLRSAANFGVLAGTSITNNSGGTTLVTGDVGSPSQTVDPVQTAGYTNYKSGAVLTTALDDMQTAITDAKSRTCDVNSAAGIDLGGLSFVPGVYCYAGSINVTGTFVMNGPGIYIFRTSSTLNTTANAVVALNGGATAANVFWVPVAATTLGANSVFQGTIMGQSAAITLGDNASLQNGRVLTGSAATLRNNVITRP